MTEHDQHLTWNTEGRMGGAFSESRSQLEPECDRSRPKVTPTKSCQRERLNLAQAVLVLLVQLYRCTLSPAKAFFFGPHAGCRFTPSCSEYAVEAIRRHRAFAGSWLALKRICRCHPWGGCGEDPVPQKEFRVSGSGFGVFTQPHATAHTAVPTAPGRSH